MNFRGDTNTQSIAKMHFVTTPANTKNTFRRVQLKLLLKKKLIIEKFYYHHPAKEAKSSSQIIQIQYR